MPTEAEIVAEKTSSVPANTSPKVEDNAYEANFDLAKEHHLLYEQFGIDPSNHPSTVDTHMAKIWEYAKAVADSKDKDAIIFEVIRLKNRLGSASLGEKPWSKVLNYVHYWKQMREADSRLKELEHVSTSNR
jgi:hypothetical protein